MRLTDTMQKLSWLDSIIRLVPPVQRLRDARNTLLVELEREKQRFAAASDRVHELEGRARERTAEVEQAHSVAQQIMNLQTAVSDLPSLSRVQSATSRVASQRG